MKTSKTLVVAQHLPKRRILLLGAALAAATPLFMRTGKAHAAPAVAKPAPAFSVVDSNGKTHSLDQYKGKVVVLEWTNHDCPYVRKHYSAGNMQKLQKEATAAGAVWLTVISSAPGEQGHVTSQQANELSKSRNAAPTAVLFDPKGTMGRAYSARTTPHMYIIDPNGTLVYMGGIDSLATTSAADVEKATPYFRNAMQSVVAGKPVQMAVTRPYGCSVKYSDA